MTAYDIQTCQYKYRVSSIEKVVDGDTIDVILDLGFDILTRQRVRLVGIDTPESRTSDKVEKKYGLLSKHKVEEWCRKLVVDKDYTNVEIRCETDSSRGKFGRVLGELWISTDNVWTNVNKWLCDNAYAVPYSGENKEMVQELHIINRGKLKHELSS